MRTRLTQIAVTLVTIAVLAFPAFANSSLAGVSLDEKKPEFLKASAVDEKFEGPGNEAVLLAKGLNAELVSDKVAVWADMIAPWPDDAEPTHLFIAIEKRDRGYPTAEKRETVQVVDLKTNEVTTVLYGLSSADGIRVTPWGTVLITEEQDDGGAWEILDPLNIKEAFADRTAGTSDNPNVVYRPALGTFAWEGIAVLPDGTLYAGDELRPENDADGGRRQDQPEGKRPNPHYPARTRNSPCRGSCAARRRRASCAGGRRTPRWCWSRGRSPGRRDARPARCARPRGRCGA